MGKKHVHQYKKIYPHGKHAPGLWGCALPDCTHYMPHNVADQVEGKQSLCNNCMEVFILDADNMKAERPICPSCENPADARTEAYIEAKLALGRMGIKNVKELTPIQRNTIERVHKIDLSILDEIEPEDKVEVEVTHTSECASYSGDACDCGAE